METDAGASINLVPSRDYPAFIQPRKVSESAMYVPKTTMFNLVYTPVRGESAYPGERGFNCRHSRKWLVIRTGRRDPWGGVPPTLNSRLMEALASISAADDLDVQYDVEAVARDDAKWQIVRILLSTERTIDKPLGYCKSLCRRIKAMMRQR